MTTTITPRELVERARRRGGPLAAGQLEQLLTRAPIAIHQGPLDVTGPWTPPARALVIDGPLTVDGALITGDGDVPPHFLVLLGPVRCTHLLAAAEATTICIGSLHVDELLFAATRDAAFLQFGPLRAGALVSGAGTSHLTSFHDQLVADAVFDHVDDGRTGRAHPALAGLPHHDLRRVMVPEVVTFEEWEGFSDEERAAELASGTTPYTYADFDEHAVHDRFEAGQPILRPDWRAALPGS